MTSPAHIEQEEEGKTVIITTKDAYFWAILFSQLVSSGYDADPGWFIGRLRLVLADQRDSLRRQYTSLDDPRQITALSVFRNIAEWCGTVPEDLLHRASAAYESLVQKKLIEDPFKKKLATFVLAVLGIVPVGFSSTTEKGGAYVKEVHAVTWSYTDEMDKDQKETRRVEIRLIKIIKILQPKILEAFDEIVGGGEEKTAKK
jgi:hypothetical protein